MFIDKYNVSYEVIDEIDEDELSAHYEFEVNGSIFDVFAYENYSHYSYCCPPDVDVNTLCWNGREYISWFDVEEFTVSDIIEKCKRMEAIAMTEKWETDYESKKHYRHRVKKLTDKGWTIL